MKKLPELLKILEIPETSCKLLYNQGKGLSFETASLYLQELQKQVLKQRKILAKKYHPDIRNKLEGENKLKEINAAVDQIQKLRIDKTISKPFSKKEMKASVYDSLWIKGSIIIKDGNFHIVKE